MSNLFSKWFGFLNKDQPYYLTDDFNSYLNFKYQIYTHFMNDEKKLLLSAYEWYTDRRPVDKKYNKHPYFPYYYEYKYTAHFLCINTFCWMFYYKIIRKYILINRLTPLTLLTFELLSAEFIVMDHIYYISSDRKIFFIDILKLDKSKYESLDISEEDVIKKLRDYNIKLNYVY